MKEKLNAIKEQAIAQIEAVGAQSAQALDKLYDIRVNYLGKKG